MANPRKRLPQNVAGDFFVDSTCINCDACRQLAPSVFADSGEHSYVAHQPVKEPEERAATRALLACPTGSIGTQGVNRASKVRAHFPLRLQGDVLYYCGFNSPKSFGGNSYFLRHSAGNWLIDAPKYLPVLARRLEELGGVRHIFLTHRDDVADADRYARHFRSTRYIHREELDAQPDAEIVLDGTDPVPLTPGFLGIPTPGHTGGHCVLLSGRYLFTGDHLAWDRDEQRLDASEDYCWDSWPEQKRSLAKLAAYDFEWLLPGHGQRVHFPLDRMRLELDRLLVRLGIAPSATR